MAKKTKRASGSLRRSARPGTKTLSVIIPTLNEELLIGDCLRSVRALRMNRKELEIIVADNHSHDRTRSIARSAGARVIVVHRRGIGKARNAGAAVARGKILLFVDADATLHEDFWEQMSAVFRDPEVAVCTGIAHADDGRRFARFVYWGTYTLVKIFRMSGIVLFPGVCVAYRREAFRAAGGFREDLGVAEDLDLSRRVGRLGRSVVCRNARAAASTRRLQKHGLSVVVFHIVNDIRYLVTGHAARSYPKTEETARWSDIWKS